MSKAGTQILTLTGLRFDANLGILDHEKTAPQPIMVDAELNLGTQPLLPSDDNITHVLDYRKVRKIIIDECRAEHVNLLESLIGKLAYRLMQLPGVLGVRVKIANRLSRRLRRCPAAAPARRACTAFLRSRAG